MCLLEQGRQDFNPLQCSMLSVVFLAAFRSLTPSSHVVLAQQLSLTQQSFLLMVLQPIPASCRSKILSRTSFDSSLVLPMLVEQLECKKCILLIYCNVVHSQSAGARILVAFKRIKYLLHSMTSKSKLIMFFFLDFG